MKIEKKVILGAIGWLPAFLIYNLILFVLIGNMQMTPSFWCSYIFVLVAFLMQILVTCVTYKRHGVRPRDLFLGYPISRSAVIYLVAELITGTVIMLIPACDVKVSFIIQILLFGVEVTFLVSGLIAKDHVEKLQAKDEARVFYVRNLMTDVQAMAQYAGNPDLKKNLERLAEELRYSDPVGHEALLNAEQFIADRIAYLDTCVRGRKEEEAQQVCALVRAQLRERNMKCKILK